jgi:hypothetical protein
MGPKLQLLHQVTKLNISLSITRYTSNQMQEQFIFNHIPHFSRIKGCNGCINLPPPPPPPPPPPSPNKNRGKIYIYTNIINATKPHKIFLKSPAPPPPPPPSFTQTIPSITAGRLKLFLYKQQVYENLDSFQCKQYPH